MRDLLVALIVFGSVPFTFVRPHIGVYVWTWLSLMSPHRMTWGFAQTMRVALVVGAMTIIAWLISREPKRPPMSAPVVILVIFTIWVSFCNLFAVNPTDAFVKWSEVIKILAMTFVTMCLLQSRERIYIMVWVMTVSIGFYGFRGGIFTILTGGNYRVWGPPGTFIEDNNQLALAMIMTLPLMWYLFLDAKERWVKAGLLAGTALTMISVAGTHSRGGAVALCVMLSALWFKSRYKIATLAVAVVVVLGTLSFLPEHWYARMSTISTYDEDMSVRGRFDAWTFGWRVALERPIVGGGLRVFYDGAYFMRLVPDAIMPRNAHSIYFEVLGETGFVGLGLFLALGIASLLTAGSVIRLTKARPDFDWARNLAAMCQVSLVGYASAGAFLNLGFFDLYYFMITLIVCLKYVVQQELAAADTKSDQTVTSGITVNPGPVRATS
jgi:putative inorganic carbon (HCO3(-)) transporter